MDWESQEDETPKIAPGYHRVKCVKVMTANKEGEAFRSNAGDPQLYTVWQAPDGSEALAVFTLTEKAGWTLRKCLQRVGANVGRLNAERVGIGDFANDKFAGRVLLDKEGWALAKLNKGYINLDFVNEDDVPVEAIKSATVKPSAGHEPVADDEIPF